MIELDGAFGEGGGQILRSALSLSLITGKPFRIYNIRAGRSKPGLRPQHLKAVEACAHISGAQVAGHELGASRLSFRPGKVRPGSYHFDIGTAGSVSLLFQAIFLPLSLAGGSSTVTLVGGTHVPWSPCFHYLEKPWQEFMRRVGFNCELELVRAGYYPKGGGLLRAVIHPAGELRGLELPQRGELIELRGLSMVSNLPRQIASRQKRRAETLLQELDIAARIEETELPSPGKGTMLYLDARFQHSQAAYFGLGAIGKRAEQVAEEACAGFKAFMQTSAAVDEHLADQLALPLALTRKASIFTTCRITRHLLTNARVIERFLPIRAAIEGDLGSPGRVMIGAR